MAKSCWCGQPRRVGSLCAVHGKQAQDAVNGMVALILSKAKKGDKR